ncbi:META domain-containing protein [Burkholderia gladioli]|uniref:META domain-containing protein n=1 Tax=Burkholderia gladioli TaxID=28095 RepID=UPI0016400DCA|nr:META domain-containing protein [Burkholderia gladioli]
MHKPSAAARTRPSFVRSLRAPLAAISLAALAACAIPTHPDSSAPPSDPFNPAAIQLIDDTSWQLASWRNADGTQRELPPQDQGANGQPAVPTLTLSTADGVRRASGFSGCNRFGGTYAVKNGLLSFGPLAGTRMACPNSAGGRLEAPYLDALAHVTKAGLQMQAPQQLYLVTQDGATLTFSRRDTP